MTGMGLSNNNQNGMPPPLTEIVATPEEERKTHIEVCVRIRPLVVSKESSTSFLSSSSGQQPTRNKASSSSIPLSSGIPRPTSKLGLSPPRHRVSQLRTPRSSSAIPQPSQRSPPSSLDESELDSLLLDNTAESQSYAWSATSPDTVTQAPEIENIPGRTDSYTLDHAYGPEQSTRDLYDQSVKGLVLAAMEGYHASVLAYGQTSTGKTHTMTGTAEQPGLIPLAVRECFDYLKRLSQPREYLLRLSYMEVYKEHIRDLLAPHHPQQPPAPVRLFESAADGLVIKGLKEEVVTNPEQVFAILAEGETRRQVGATTLNAHSSRSHVIVRLWIESRAISGDAGGGCGMQRHASTSSTTSSLASSSRLGGNVRVSSLSLVDLAGSESVRLTGSNERRQEGHYINQSLMTLGKVVYALSEMGDNSNKKSFSNKTPHVPYRDSKLTRLLQPSLSGNAQVVMVCCVSPLGQHVEESHNTFKFAIRAKKIPQKATIQEAPDERTLLQSYRDEIEDLKAQLKEAQEAVKRPPSKALVSPSSASSARSPGSLTAATSLTEDVVSEDEIQELVTSIQTMEKLILKSKPTTSPQIVVHQRPEDLIDAISDDENDDDEEDLIALATTKSEGGTSVTVSASQSLQTPVRPAPLDNETDRNLEIELARIQGLLGSVLKKRKEQQTSNSGSAHTQGSSGVVSSLTSSTTSSSPDNREVLHLRAQLEQQELATSVRKADSSFLQKQLDEKDDLLLEVSKILEAVEQRQAQLDQENAVLRQQVARLQFRLGDRPDYELDDSDRSLLRQQQQLQQLAVEEDNNMGPRIVTT